VAHDCSFRKIHHFIFFAPKFFKNSNLDKVPFSVVFASARAGAFDGDDRHPHCVKYGSILGYRQFFKS
jgi:hypothetical protein